ncbi:MAG: hypothetical protein KAS01_01470 [Candidatus Pacebacteria bacterium]|nr:hypothetical protein [Candidatus Paceibacterota bacterium]
MTCTTEPKDTLATHIGKILVLPEVSGGDFEIIKEIKEIIRKIETKEPKFIISSTKGCSKFPCKEMRKQNSQDSFMFSVINCTNILKETEYNPSDFSSPEKMLRFLKEITRL